MVPNFLGHPVELFKGTRRECPEEYHDFKARR